MAKALINADGKLLVSGGKVATDDCPSNCCGGDCTPGNGIPDDAPFDDFGVAAPLILYSIAALYTSPISCCGDMVGYFGCPCSGTASIGDFTPLSGGNIGSGGFGVTYGRYIATEGDRESEADIIYFDAPATCGVGGQGSAVLLGGSALTGRWCELQEYLAFGQILIAPLDAGPDCDGHPCSDPGQIWIYVAAGLRYGIINGNGPGWHLTYGTFWTPAGTTSLNVCGCLNLATPNCATQFLGDDWAGIWNFSIGYFTLTFDLSRP